MEPSVCLIPVTRPLLVGEALASAVKDGWDTITMDGWSRSLHILVPVSATLQNAINLINPNPYTGPYIVTGPVTLTRFSDIEVNVKLPVVLSQAR